jgi:hypothetical protein
VTVNSPQYWGFLESDMRTRSMTAWLMGVGMLLVSGCEVARSARNDFANLTNSVRPPSQAQKSSAPKVQTQSQPMAGKADPSVSPAPPEVAAAAPAPVVTGDQGPAFPTGTSERELRALLGAPTSEEEHPPGKQWRYRDGKCSVDIQLYPDVETKQFATVAYKVKSDDSTDEGRRLCVAQLQSRVQARR